MTVEEFLGRHSDGFHFGEELLGAFGGVFGGALVAATISAAREVAPGRTPAGIDCRFLRVMPPGDAVVVVRTVHEGRSLSCVNVDLFDARQRLATNATVTLVDNAALYPLSVEPPLVLEHDWRGWAGRGGLEIAIAKTLQPRLAPLAGGGAASGIAVPWDDDGTRSAEAACLAGDLCVGAPVAAAVGDPWRPHPNPDMSLRLTPLDVPVAEVVGIGRVVRSVAGQVVVAIEVQDGRGVAYAAGASTSMILGGPD